VDLLPRLFGTSGLLLPIAKQQLSWDGQAPSDLLVLAKAGHRSGVYLVAAELLVRVVPAAGVVDRVISFNAPGLPAQTILNPASYGISAAAGVYGFDFVAVPSDGSADLTVQFFAGGVVLPCEIDLYACAVLVNRRS
jgi:hypothetical protein